MSSSCYENWNTQMWSPCRKCSCPTATERFGSSLTMPNMTFGWVPLCIAACNSTRVYMMSPDSSKMQVYYVTENLCLLHWNWQQTWCPLQKKGFPMFRFNFWLYVIKNESVVCLILKVKFQFMWRTHLPCIQLYILFAVYSWCKPRSQMYYLLNL